MKKLIENTLISVFNDTQLQSVISKNKTIYVGDLIEKHT